MKKKQPTPASSLTQSYQPLTFTAAIRLTPPTAFAAGADDVTNAVRQIQHATPRLNLATDQIADVVRRLEKFLTDIGVGVPVEVPVAQPDRQAAQHARYLAYAKGDEGFRVRVIERDAATGREIFNTPLLNCPRDVKVEVFPAVPALLIAIGKRAEKLVEDMANHATHAESLLAALRCVATSGK